MSLGRATWVLFSLVVLLGIWNLYLVRMVIDLRQEVSLTREMLVVYRTIVEDAEDAQWDRESADFWMKHWDNKYFADPN